MRAAQALGFTGAGYRIGVIDTGINTNHPALQGRVSDSFIYVDPRTNNVAAGDVVGHGTVVAQLAAGRAVGQWPGGIASGAGPCPHASSAMKRRTMTVAAKATRSMARLDWARCMPI